MGTHAFVRDLNEYSRECHDANRLWWTSPDGEYPIPRNKSELLMLMVSEIAEAQEGVRKDLADKHLPHRSAEEVELADCLIRIFDYAGAFGLDLEGALWEKMAYNAQRVDHTHEHRFGSPDGKKF